MEALDGARRRLLLDVGLGAVLGVVGFVDGLATPDFPRPSPTVALLMALAGCAQSLRRLRPMLAFTVSMSAMGAVAVLFGHFESGAALLIIMAATYSVVVHGTNLPYVLAVQVGFCAALNLSEPVEEALWDSAFTLAFAGLVLGAGLAVRSMRGRATESAAHADVLELQRDDAARTAAEQERQLLARELHDILAHGLGVIALQAGAAEHALDDDPDRARAALASVRATAQDAIGELETLVHAVRAQAANNRQPQPTLADLPRLARQASCGDFLVDLRVDGEPRTVPAAIQASIYRVAQEGLTNAMKHSGTSSCGLVLAYGDQNVRIEVTDDGVRGSRAPGSRAGLAGVAERVSVFGGSVRVGPREQGGWALVAEFPTRR